MYLYLNTSDSLKTYFVLNILNLFIDPGVYPYLPLTTNAQRTILGDFIKSLTNFSVQKST